MTWFDHYYILRDIMTNCIQVTVSVAVWLRVGIGGISLLLLLLYRYAHWYLHFLMILMLLRVNFKRRLVHQQRKQAWPRFSLVLCNSILWHAYSNCSFSSCTGTWNTVHSHTRHTTDQLHMRRQAYTHARTHSIYIISYTLASELLILHLCGMHIFLNVVFLFSMLVGPIIIVHVVAKQSMLCRPIHLTN